VTDRHAFIERMGLTSESDGLSRIAGRLFGALLLADQPRSLDDLAEQLDVSKASVSTEARRLVERGVAERIGKTGDRRDYYALAPDFFAQIVRFRLNRWSALHRLIRDMEAGSSGEPRVVRERFAYIDDVHAFVLSRVEAALAEWTERARGARSRPARKSGTSRGAARERLG
jgi:predicted transcriptional regulator